MKTLRHKILFLTFAILLLLAITFALFSYYSEPRHNGRPLSAWLEEYDRNMYQRSEAADAIRAIGTNATPTLVKMLIPGRKLSIARLLERARIPIELIEDTSDRMRGHRLAMHGFRLLGPTASNALPELLNHLENPDRAYYATEAIQAIGPPAIAPVQQFLTSTNLDARRHAVHILISVSRRDPATVSNLLAHPDPIVRGEAYIWFPDRRRQSPSEILEILLGGIKDPDTYVACRAAITIRSLGLDATNALPRLYELSATTNALLAAEINSTIKNIEKRVRIEQFDSRHSTSR